VSAHERERLCAYLDGELPSGERTLVDAHLAACAECAAFLAALATVDEAAAALPAEAPDGYFDGFAARVVGRIEAGSAGARARRLPAWAWAAAAVLLLAVVTPLTLRSLRPGPAGAPEPELTVALASPIAPPLRPQPEVASPSSKGSGRLAGSPAASLPRKPDEARTESAFALEPAAPAQGAAGSVAALSEAQADVVIAQAPAAAAAPPEARGKGARDRQRSDAAETAVEPMARSAESADLAAVGTVEDPERAFRRLDAVRPRTGDDWRRLRDDWAAFVSAHPNTPRADEARVRSIEAGWQAWLSSGEPDEEGAFRRDARAYLERADARQAERVRRLLASRP